MNEQRSLRGGWSFGLGAGLSKNVTLRNNTVYRSHGEGIGLYLSDQGQIEGNTVYDNYAVNIYLDNTTNTKVSRNLVYSTGDQRFFRNGRPTNGIQIANEDYRGLSNPSRANRITNNYLIQNGAAFCYGGYQKGGGLVDTIFSNNTVFGSTGAMISIDADKGHQATRIENNIFHQTSRFAFTYQPNAGEQIAFKNNLWFGAPVPKEAQGPGDQKVDPQFSNPGGFSRKDYQPAKGSEASKGSFGAREE